MTFLVPAVMSLFNIKLFDCMGYLGAIYSYGFLTVYVLISIAAPVYLHKIGKLRLQDIVFSVVAIAFMMIPVVGSVGIPGSTMFPPPEAPYDKFPYLFLMYLVATCGWFVLQRLRSPELAGSMRHRVDAIHSKFDSEGNAIYGSSKLNPLPIDSDSFD
ncbi:hypothetical protein [Microcoleus sp. CAWBG640]|uniref:hypothetical protein n=1 Tax=Microcoleus sp. CAWBG640 TaxID=2841653 RepID=UPI00312B59A5